MVVKREGRGTKVRKGKSSRVATSVASNSGMKGVV
jgi:hypothetical protein